VHVYFVPSGLNFVCAFVTRGDALRACPWLSYSAPLALWFDSKHERLDGMREAFDLRGLAVHPEEVVDLLVGLVHHHDRNTAIRIEEAG